MICQINGALTFFVYYFNWVFLRLIITCRLWTNGPPMSSVPIKADKINLSLWVIVNWALKNKHQLNRNQNKKNLLIKESASENIVCEMATILSRWRWVDVPRMIPAFSLCIGQWDPNFCVYWLMRNHSLCLYIDQWETTSCVCLIWGCPFICVVCSKWLLMNGGLVWQLLIHSGSFSWTEALGVYQGLISLIPLPVDKNGRHFADIFKYIFMNKKFCILIQISLKFVLKGSINNNPALIRLMAWRLIGDKPLYALMLTQITDAYAALGGDVIYDMIVHTAEQLQW